MLFNLNQLKILTWSAWYAWYTKIIMNNPKIPNKRKIYIYIKAEDVAIYLPFGMYGNIFCMTRGSLVG